MRARYATLRLESVVWRGPRQVLLEYRFLSGTPKGGYPPGTFTLFWYPGIEAIPLTPIEDSGKLLFLVAVRGETTKAIYKAPPRYAGVIGPLGKEYQPDTSRGDVLLVAGGAGIAALAPLARVLARRVGVTVVYGARTAGEVPPLDKLLGGGAEVVYATEDGSLGVKGTAVDVLEHIDVDKYGYIVAAGPSAMLCKLYSLARRERYLEKLVLAVETYVRCGLGFCGKCIVPGTQHRLCVDGMFYHALELGEGWFSGACRGM